MNENANDLYKKTSKTSTSIVLVVVAIIIIGLGSLFYIKYKQNYNRFQTATTGTQIAQQVKYGAKNNQLTVLMDYRSGCTHCESIHDAVIKNIEKNYKGHNVNFVMVNSNNESVRNYLLKHGVLSTPTVAVLYKGKVMQQYTGTNTKKFNRLLQGTDINTGNALPTPSTGPLNALVVNDELKSTKQLDLNQHPDLNYNLN